MPISNRVTALGAASLLPNKTTPRPLNRSFELQNACLRRATRRLSGCWRLLLTRRRVPVPAVIYRLVHGRRSQTLHRCPARPRSPISPTLSHLRHQTRPRWSARWPRLRLRSFRSKPPCPAPARASGPRSTARCCCTAPTRCPARRSPRTARASLPRPPRTPTPRPGAPSRPLFRAPVPATAEMRPPASASTSPTRHRCFPSRPTR